MKRILIFIGCLFLCLSAAANPRSVKQAKRLVSSPAKLRHCHTAHQLNGQPAFYVFNRGKEEGFVIVSADDRAYTILGYSDHGHWDDSAIPDNMRAWLEAYTEDISALQTLSDATTSDATTTTYTPVAPLCTT